MIILAKIYSFIKDKWYIFVILLAVLVVRSLLNNAVDNVGLVIKEFRKYQSEQIAAIQTAADARDQANKESIKRLEEKLMQIEHDYVAAKEKLEQKKTVEIKQLLDTSKDDPEKLAKHLSTSTGFKIIMVETP